MVTLTLQNQTATAETTKDQAPAKITLTIANRIVVAPMSMYSSKDGFVIDFQLVHLGSYALHGAGLVFTEASAAESRGRITPGTPQKFVGQKSTGTSFGAAAVRADKAGMDTVQIQGAYSYLIHTFLSPLTNHRTDNNIPSFVIEEAVQVARWTKDAGLDIIHVVAVGHTPREKMPRFPDYLVHYAAQIRQDVPGLAVIAVRIINSGKQAQEIVESGKADLVAAASVFLKHPTFALDAGRELGVDVIYAPLHPCRYA
ncbi:hypothetical protein BGZ91_009468 [Linnemannia elongata]|nr:hypothetical protein BGZ91_009468 [Linnemannia elongata]